MGVFARAFEIVRSATEDGHASVGEPTDLEGMAAYELHNMACTRAIRAIHASIGQTVSDGDIMSAEYRKPVGRQLRLMQRVALQGWELNPEGTSYGKRFQSHAILEEVLNILAHVDIHDAFTKGRQRHGEAALTAYCNKEEMDKLFAQEGIDPPVRRMEL